LDGRILELRGTPLRLLRQLSGKDGSVEAIHAFGDRLHLRVAVGQAAAVIEGLGRRIAQEGGHVDRLRVIPPLLEDVFISLSESAYE
jgi:hypothetical protein